MSAEEAEALSTTDIDSAPDIKEDSPKKPEGVIETAKTDDSEQENPPAIEKEIDETKKGPEDERPEEATPPLPARKKTNDILEAKAPEENPILTQLKEAFPNVEEKYVKAVIIASQGALDPAFSALLFLSDPESGADIELPSQPVVHKAPDLPQRRKQTQLEQDELLARQLDEQFNKNRHSQRVIQSRRQVNAAGREAGEARRERIRERHRRNQQPLSPEEQRELYGEDEDSWAQFMEKELPELKEKANRSIQETATKLNGWISGFRRNIVGDYAEPGNSNERDYYDDEAYEQKISEKNNDYTNSYAPKKPERRRFNSFGAQVGEESLENHGITLHNDDSDAEYDEEDDVPPQLPSKNSEDGKPKDVKIVPESTFIDTPDASTRKKWQPVAPEPLNATPTKVVVTPDDRKANRNADEDEFLINSDDEM
ncbi:hypothetical protein HG535_0A05810 [Zygotorulaspora mrakii]|uniref:CUE domain-containing protein n=1 Tax=Zygotorulaspora mrakii TaxID=42260 RepID=A0A7H9AW68_ZYGMR|nr:uncharacterized protein HG535_0A05810 [Zygotorulaspora mrakii]QLG70640.1 hypothetical protein HG535_0A05810 [Zygotorulaspora mrakii]